MRNAMANVQGFQQYRQNPYQSQKPGGDPYSLAKQTNPSAFYGPSLMKRYNGDTNALSSMFSGLNQNQVEHTVQPAGPTGGGTGLAQRPTGPQERVQVQAPPNWAGSYSYMPGSGQTSPYNASQGWGADQAWQWIMRMFGGGAGFPGMAY